MSAPGACRRKDSACLLDYIFGGVVVYVWSLLTKENNARRAWHTENGKETFFSLSDCLQLYIIFVLQI